MKTDGERESGIDRKIGTEREMIKLDLLSIGHHLFSVAFIILIKFLAPVKNSLG